MAVDGATAARQRAGQASGGTETLSASATQSLPQVRMIQSVAAAK